MNHNAATREKEKKLIQRIREVDRSRRDKRRRDSWVKGRHG
jgi:hypothetical protein